jgi:hypothetical protein
MKAIPIPINWHSGLPIFASESFLKAVSDKYGWIGGIDESGKLRCILPYTIIQVAMIRMVRFRVETIPLGEGVDIDQEKSFLNGAIEYLRSIGADAVIPATTNTIFRTYPDGADAAPYGSHVIDLSQSEEILWRNVSKITRQNIGTAHRNGVIIKSGVEYLDQAYILVRDTFRRSKLPFMSHGSFEQFVLGLGENVKIMVADYQGIPHSCTVFPFSSYGAYAVYGGSIARAHQGAMKLVQWEAIRLFRNCGIQRYDFVGARINPQKGSKQEALNAFKTHLGGKLRQGYIWKYSIRSLKSYAYSLAVRALRGGDIVDNERHKMDSARSLPIVS